MRQHTGVGMLLFLCHASFANNNIQVRLHGPCAVQTVVLNNIIQPALTQEANFIMSFCPRPGKNNLKVKLASAPLSKAKLLICAYRTQLLQPSSATNFKTG